ncbi:MAG: hypothetical protein OEV85_12330 [Candidatus Thorarchaeota archaeon]|nr:hypothetical protein [Candidatus Thorarchaeota archaeon]
MNVQDNEEKVRWRYSMTPNDVGLLLVFVVFFLPAFISTWDSGHQIAFDISSLMWRIIFYRDGMIAPELNLYGLAIFPYVFLKYLLILQAIRYYKFLVSEKHFLILALLSEMQAFLMLDLIRVISRLLSLTDTPWSNFSWSMIPIPFTMMTCIFLIKLVPRQEPKPVWIDKEKERSWWKGKSDDLSNSKNIKICLNIYLLDI